MFYNACKMAEAEVKEWLRSIPASVDIEKTYFQKLIDKGYDDLKTISTLPVNILDEVLEVPKVHGHIKKFEAAIEKLSLRKQLDGTVPSEEQKLPNSTGIKQLKAKRQSTIVFSSGGKFMKLETEKNQPEYPWSKFLIPNPHSERLRFYNGIVEPLFKSSHQNLGIGFHEYLLNQQKERWEGECQKKKLQDQSDQLFRLEKSGHAQSVKRFSTSEPNNTTYREKDVLKCQEVLVRVENHLDAVKDLKSKLEGKREKLFNADHQLKKYACNEHQHWVSTIGEIDDLLKEAQKYTNQITFIKNYLQKRFPCSAKGTNEFKSEKKRRKKENKRLARKRKQQRLIRRASNILLTMSTAGIAKEFADKVKDGNVVNLVKPSHFEISAFNKLSKRFDQKPLFFLIQNKVLTEDVIKIIKQKFPSWVNEPENKDVTETDQSSSDENESDTDTLS